MNRRFDVETIAQAIAILEDENNKEKERVDAAHYLGKNGSTETAFALVAALDDDDYGVHREHRHRTNV